MSVTKIKIDKIQFIDKLNKQITKGSVLAKRGFDFIKSHPDHSLYRSEVDKFKMEVNQWIDITQSILYEVFTSPKYGSEFKNLKTSKREYVSSSWQPDIKFYLEYGLLPKLNYLKIVRDNIDDLEEVETENLTVTNTNKEKENSTIEETIKTVEKISVDNYDFSKITIPQLRNILSIPQIIKIISFILGLLVAAFWVGYYFYSFQTNENLSDSIDKLSTQFEDLKIQNDTLFSTIKKLVEDTIKAK